MAASNSHIDPNNDEIHNSYVLQNVMQVSHFRIISANDH